MNLEERARSLIDERLFDAYWASVEHFGTTDLVLYLDTEEEVDPLHVFVRERLLANPDAPSFLKSKVSKPAKDAAVNMKGASTAFWFIASFPDEMFVTAVIAERIGQGGSA